MSSRPSSITSAPSANSPTAKLPGDGSELPERGRNSCPAIAWLSGPDSRMIPIAAAPGAVAIAAMVSLVGGRDIGRQYSNGERPYNRPVRRLRRLKLTLERSEERRGGRGGGNRD